MTRGSLIAYHRKRLNLTQTELGDMVNVTAQAVSKWEKGMSEPDLSTIQKLCRIFGIDVTEFFKEDESDANESGTEAEEIGAPSAKDSAPVPTPAPAPAPAPAPTPKIIIGYCESCKRPVAQGEKYAVERVGRSSVQRIYCPACDLKRKATNAHGELYREQSALKRAFIWGGSIAAALAIAFIIVTIVQKDWAILSGLIVAVAAFTFTSQCFWEGFIADFFMFFVRGFSKPGLIFTLDLDGIIWLITVKLFLFIVCGLLSVICFIFGLALSLILSLFSFPFSLMAELHKISNLKESCRKADEGVKSIAA